jgi:hypothetical protein
MTSLEENRNKIIEKLKKYVDNDEILKEYANTLSVEILNSENITLEIKTMPGKCMNIYAKYSYDSSSILYNLDQRTKNKLCSYIMSNNIMNNCSISGNYQDGYTFEFCYKNIQ